MSQTSHVSDINFSVAFETNKICATLVGSYNASNATTLIDVVGPIVYQHDIPHSFTRPVFIDMLISLNNTAFLPQGTELSNSQTLIAISDSSNIYLLNTDNSNTTYYYWIVCSWIEDFDNTNPLIKPTFQSVNADASVTTFDSRENYQKIFYNQVQSITPGTFTTSSLPIPHNLGVTPNHKIFFEALPGQVWPSIGNTFNSLFAWSDTQMLAYGYVDTANLYIGYQSQSDGSAFRVWPTIYYDH